jgi:hypothetical protein
MVRFVHALSDGAYGVGVLESNVFVYVRVKCEKSVRIEKRNECGPCSREERRVTMT